MPELGFYFTESDIADVVQHCLDSGAFLIPDSSYDEPQYAEIKDLSKFREVRETSPSNLFFIVSYEYFECPLEMRPVVKDGAQKYFISPKNGGPTIDLFCPRVFSKSGIDYIPAGSISHYSSYRNTKKRAMTRPPESLKTFYQTLTKAMKGSSTIARSKHRAFLVGQGTTARIAGGAKLGRN